MAIDTTRWAPYAQGLLRMIAGFQIMQHGVQKWFGLLGSQGGPVPLGSLSGVAGVMETIGGALLLVGLFTRPVAFLLSGELAVAYFLRHAPRGFFPIMNRGEGAVLFCFIFLFLAAAGPGAFSLDGLLARRRGREHL